ncbi:MAG: hypothetical protein ACLP19_02675 [Xanthobacteraceae bacterium]
MITSIKAARLDALAKEWDSVYGFPADDAHVSACTHGFCLLMATCARYFAPALSPWKRPSVNAVALH